MELPGFFHFLVSIFISVVLLSEISVAVNSSVPTVARIYPEFSASFYDCIDNDGIFLLSNNSNFAVRLSTSPTQNFTFVLLVVIYIPTSQIVWTANRGSMVREFGKFVFDKTGNVYLENQGRIAWSTNTAGKGVAAMELQDSGNLVLLTNDSKPVWQSFSYPTDTLLSDQLFFDGMRLVSEPNANNLSFYLEMKFGDLILYGGFKTPQPYWSLANDVRKTINKEDGVITSASIISNSWRFFDRNQSLVWQFIFSDNSSSPNVTWAAVLGADGFISFYSLQYGSSVGAGPLKIPQDECTTPMPCGPYGICDKGKICQCLGGLSTQSGCNPGIGSPCNNSKSSVKLLDVGDEYYYFALGFISPFPNYDLNSCMAACLNNCSCLVLFFENSSGNCFLFDQIGSLEKRMSSSRFLSYIKTYNIKDEQLNPGRGESKNRNRWLLLVIVAATIFLVVVGLFCLGFWYYQKDKRVLGYFQDVMGEEAFEDNNFLENISSLPFRFTYKDLQTTTNNFSVKLGQGGFGSVYKGMLPDGTQIAVKKLEGFVQGKREFQTEVATIGSIHHVHLVKLKGFCVEGSHSLLAYEYMENGSLDKWIFRKDGEGATLDWETRFNIALGLAKGLAYLHEGCSVKIVHCDIKPGNVLLDDNYQAKISDFGLAKLMTREQSRVVTMFRGTRGYLAPEWITNRAISEKCDVYSFGMVFLEIIGGRKNFNLADDLEIACFPSYALKMMEIGKPEKILDSKLNIEKSDKRICIAIKVALWCIQGDMSLRPSMSKVVQMLEGSCTVPELPSSPQMISNFFALFVRPITEEGTSRGVCSDANLSCVQLSGPR